MLSKLRHKKTFKWLRQKSPSRLFSSYLLKVASEPSVSKVEDELLAKKDEGVGVLAPKAKRLTSVDQEENGEGALWALSQGREFLEKSRRSSWKGISGRRKEHREVWSGIPSQGRSFKEVQDDLTENLLSHVVTTQNPSYMGHMTADIPQECHEADILISYLNQNMVKRETSGLASDLESQVLRWFHELIYRGSDIFYKAADQDPQATLGLMVSGGTMANLSALTIARGRALLGVESLGMNEALKRSGYEKAVVLTSHRSHYSIAKACSLMGLGRDQLISVAVDPYDQKIHLPTLRRTILDLQSRNVLIIAVVGVASSTETGSIDDLQAMAGLCQSRKIWFHVDGAWGGAYLFSEKLAPLLKGLEQADSVVVDAHKMLGLTMGGGMVFFKDPSTPQTIEQSSHYVLRRGSRDLGRFHLEGSRPFYGLKIWMLAQRRGREGLQAMVEESHEKARLFYKVLGISGHFIPTTPLETNILTYQWCPKPLYQVLKSFPDQLLWQHLHDVLNEVHHHLHELGCCGVLPGFVSKTQISIQRGGRVLSDVIVLRAIPVGGGTTAWHIKALLEQQHRYGMVFFRDAFLERLKKQGLEGEFYGEPLWQDFEDWLASSIEQS